MKVESAQDRCACECARCGAKHEHERYIISERVANKPSADDDNNNSNSVLHVLVSRPQIAGKPRDNIVLEGDMDLRTTFETSYEALAKLRLEHWRKTHHACTTDKLHNDVSAHAQAAPKTPTADACVAVVEQICATPDNERRVDESVTAQLTGSALSHPHSPERAATPQPAKCTQSSETQTQTQAHGAHSIDPDLSAIFMYDSNMNRLERVGARRRSKYRPSTSLRSGGFRADADADASLPQQQQQQQQQHQQHQHQQQPATTGPARAETRAMRHDPLAAGFVTPEKLALDRRNLANSSQPDKLVYSERNIPVAARRRCDEHANLRDHFRDQIRANVNQTIDDETLLARREEAEAIAELQRIIEPSDGAHDAAADRPATQPEATQAQSRTQSNAARDDRHARESRLQRTCQNQNFDIYNNEYPDGHNTATFTTMTKADATTRTHNQNAQADVSQKQMAHVGGGGGELKPVGPTAYNDLFRESPDFLLSTRGDRGWPVQSSLNGHTATPEASALSDAPKEIANELRYTMITPEECRVSRLDDQYLYVGTQMGHSFYLDKSNESTLTQNTTRQS